MRWQISGVKLFLSCVSDEFGVYRDALRQRADAAECRGQDPGGFQGARRRHAQDARGVHRAVRGGRPFRRRHDGLDAGAEQRRRSAQAPPELEARLAEKGLGRDALQDAYLHAMGGVARDRLRQGPPDRRAGRGRSARPKLRADDASRAAQAQHLERLRAINRYPGPPFTSADNLVAQIFASAVIDALVKAADACRHASRATCRSLRSATSSRAARRTLDGLARGARRTAKGAAVVGRALHGLGGIGKTRLAIEYAWATRPTIRRCCSCAPTTRRP